MRSKKPVLLLVLALGGGLAASIGISQVLSRNQDTGPVEETVPVWVAMVDIKPNEALSPQNLKLEQWPKEKVPPGALSKLEDIDGKRTRSNLYQGDVVLNKKLAGHDPGVGALVPPGFRLFTTQADGMNSQGGLLQPGDRVDVVLYIPKGVSSMDAGTKTILQDLRVFAVNDVILASEDRMDQTITAKTVTLLVTPSQAEKAALATEIGKIRLVMRGPKDDGLVDPVGQTVNGLLSVEKVDRQVQDLNKPLPGSKPETVKPVEKPQPQVAVVPDDQHFTMQVIKGTEIARAEFTRKWDDSSRWENGSYSIESQGSPPTPAAAPPVQSQPQQPPQPQTIAPRIAPTLPKDFSALPGR